MIGSISRLAHDRARSIAAGLALIAFVSAVWIESDAYRYAGLAMVAWGLVIYLFGSKDFKPRIGWVGWLCMIWVASVVLRALMINTEFGSISMQAAEGVYLLPAGYITVGYFFFLKRYLLGPFLQVFFLISVVGLAVSIDWVGLAQHPDARLNFLFQNNLIHASVAAGFIVIAGIFAWAELMVLPKDSPIRRYGPYLLAAIMALCAVGLFGAKSKGVWIALVLALPFCLVQALSTTPKRGRLQFLAAALVMLIAVGVILRASAMSAIQPLINSTGELAHELSVNGLSMATIGHTIESANFGPSFAERAILWVRAINVWSHDWTFGNGLYWRVLWFKPEALTTPYAIPGLQTSEVAAGPLARAEAGDLLHNGYLEIAVRYGLLGFAFYAVLFGWALRQSWLCVRTGLISRNLFGFHVVSLIYFLVTILTNSNNRLAIGESFMWLSAAFGFCCFFLLQEYSQARKSGQTGST